MRTIMQQLALMSLTIISLLAFTAHSTPQEGSIADASALLGREDTANYAVYPNDTQNEDQATAIYTLLKGVVSDPTKIFNSTTDNGTQHWFWGVPLTSANAEKVKGNSNITAVVQECTSKCANPIDDDDDDDDPPNSKLRRSDDGTDHTINSRLVKRDGQTVNAHNVDDETAFISTPRNQPLGNDYVYDDTAGTDQTVYIVDSGAGLDSADEFSRYVARNKRYLQATGTSPNDGLENDVHISSHGTGVLAKAVGWKHGVAKRSKPVIVRVAKGNDPAAWLNGVQQAYDDWLPTYNANKKTATAIINLSWGWPDTRLAQNGYPGFIGDIWKGQLAQLLNKCIDIGLLPIAASGNGLPVTNGPPVDGYPQLFAYPSNGQPPDVRDMMVIVGVEVTSEDNVVKGNRWERSKVDPPGTIVPVIELHAPSFHLTVPNKTGGWRNANEVTGVSYAAGTISGLGTYFLGLSSLEGNLAHDDPVQRVKRLKQQLGLGSSASRGDVRSLWNLADPGTCPPGTLPPGFQDGDEIPCADTSTNSGNTVIAIPNCYIMTASALPNAGINTPIPGCSCTGGVIAGIGSGTVSGTTYSWCQTGGLPSGVPTDATKEPAIQPTSQAPAPSSTQSCSHRPNVGARGIILGHDCICNIGPTPTATIIDKRYTCPTKPPDEKRGLLSFSG